MFEPWDGEYVPLEHIRGPNQTSRDLWTVLRRTAISSIAMILRWSSLLFVLPPVALATSALVVSATPGLTLTTSTPSANVDGSRNLKLNTGDETLKLRGCNSSITKRL